MSGRLRLARGIGRGAGQEVDGRFGQCPAHAASAVRVQCSGWIKTSYPTSGRYIHTETDAAPERPLN
jgi:hypothetical protein